MARTKIQMKMKMRMRKVVSRNLSSRKMMKNRRTLAQLNSKH
jgi:hypothetical protein